MSGSEPNKACRRPCLVGPMYVPSSEVPMGEYRRCGNCAHYHDNESIPVHLLTSMYGRCDYWQAKEES